MHSRLVAEGKNCIRLPLRRFANDHEMHEKGIQYDFDPRFTDDCGNIDPDYFGGRVTWMLRMLYRLSYKLFLDRYTSVAVPSSSCHRFNTVTRW